jgi:LCP family protein required for cell wall assembly
VLVSLSLFLVAGVYVGRLAWQLGFIFHRNPIAAIGDVIGGSGGSSVGQKVSAQQRINIAVYGYGGQTHDGGYLSDSIMVLSILPEGNGKAQVAEISIPRDWYVPIDLGNGHQYKGRINEAYSDGQTDSYPNRADVYKGDHGGGILANATLENLLGIHIDHFVGIDFHAFQYAVDAVGGVDVVVPHTFTDYSYPRGECSGGRGDCSYMTVHFNAGLQHMNGATALIFARSRHSSDNGEGTDFARSRRQQLVVQALKQKVVSVDGIGKLPDVLGALGGHVITDMGIGDVKALYDLVKNVDPATVEHVSIDDSNFLYECGGHGLSDCTASYLFARDTSYRSVSTFVQHVFPPPLSISARTAVTVQDGSGAGGAASTRWTSLLQGLHVNAVDGGRVPLSATTRVILSGTDQASTQTAQYLASLYGVSVEDATPGATVASGSPATATGATPPAAAGVTLILGSDEERAFNASTPGYYGYAYSTRTTTTTTRRSTTTTTQSTTSSTTTTSSSSSSSTTTGLPLPHGKPTPTPVPSASP